MGVGCLCPGPLLPSGGLERGILKAAGGVIRRAAIGMQLCSPMLDHSGTLAPPARPSSAPAVLSSHLHLGHLGGPQRTHHRCLSFRPRSAPLRTTVLCDAALCRILTEEERPRDLLHRRTSSRSTLLERGQRRGVCWRGSGEGQTRTQ